MVAGAHRERAETDADAVIGTRGYIPPERFDNLDDPKGDVYALVEGMMEAIFREAAGIQLETPFPRIAYDDAMNLYGSDMDETTSPLESGLAWTVAMQPAERNFIGRQALQSQLDAGGLKYVPEFGAEGRDPQRAKGPINGGAESLQALVRREVLRLETLNRTEPVRRQGIVQGLENPVVVRHGRRTRPGQDGGDRDGREQGCDRSPPRSGTDSTVRSLTHVGPPAEWYAQTGHCGGVRPPTHAPGP